MYCIDASVLIAVFDETDTFHETSLKLFELIIQTDVNVIIPAFALVEIAGALSRKGYKIDDITNYLNYLRICKNIEFILLDNDLYESAISIALRLKIKGGDSIYIAISSFFNLTLVTYDNQQRERGKEIINTATPESVYSKS